MKILLISGHGAGDPGATATISGRVYREANEARAVAAGLASALRDVADVAVYPTDRNAFEDYRKGTLAAVARFSQYDYVLEIHFNALAPNADGKTKGVECYVTTSEKGTTVEEAICRNVSALGLTNRGVKRKNWSVIQSAKNAGVSAALLEVCFIDDVDDMRIYTADREKVVQAIAGGVRDGLGLEGEKMTQEQFNAMMDAWLAERAKREPSAWSAADREWAETNGIIRGDADGNKRYKSFVTREELAATLHRADK